MDNQVSIYKTEGRRASTSDGLRKQSKPEKAVALHTKYITRCSFFGSDQQVCEIELLAVCGRCVLSQTMNGGTLCLC